MDIVVKITPNEKGTPVGQLAEAELQFFGDSPLAGLRLCGFHIWARRSGESKNVTYPARQYTVNGERRSYALLRPITDASAQERLRTVIVDADEAYMADAPA